VPRLLQEKRQNDKLKEYITKSNDKVLFRWMAQLCESQVPIVLALLALRAQKYLLYLAQKFFRRKVQLCESSYEVE